MLMVFDRFVLGCCLSSWRLTFYRKVRIFVGGFLGDACRTYLYSPVFPTWSTPNSNWLILDHARAFSIGYCVAWHDWYVSYSCLDPAYTWMRNDSHCLMVSGRWMCRSIFRNTLVVAQSSFGMRFHKRLPSFDRCLYCSDGRNMAICPSVTIIGAPVAIICLCDKRVEQIRFHIIILLPRTHVIRDNFLINIFCHILKDGLRNIGI